MPVATPDRVPRLCGELIARRRVGAHHHLTFVAPGIGELARPGQLVAVGVGGQTSANLLRRAFWIHRVSPSGTYGGTVEIVVAAVGVGTRWLTGLTLHAGASIIGPVGRPFPLPTEPVPAVLVGGGYGSAPLLWLAAVLRERGCRLEMLLTAPTEDRLFGVVEARRLVEAVTVTTEDGSAGRQAPIRDVLPAMIRRSGAAVVYGCGPNGMLAASTAVAVAEGAVAQVAPETSMACGVGVCMSCALPVTGRDGATHLLRSCVEGPAFRGDRICWDRLTSAGAR